MQRLKPDVDIVWDVLQAVAAALPDSIFAQSILLQYQERGGLSKKQLEGLLGKAKKINTISAAKLATLEAIILKKHTKERSPLPTHKPLFKKDEQAGKMIAEVLEKYPQHKAVLFFKTKFDNNELLTTAELTMLRGFYKLLHKA